MSVRTEVTFAIVPEWILDSEISDRALRLYGVLARYADKEGRAHPSRATLAKRLRCSLNSVDRALHELYAAGIVRREIRSSDHGDNETNLYFLAVSGPQTSSSVGPGLPRRGEGGGVTAGEGGSPRLGTELEPLELEPDEREKALASQLPTFAEFYEAYPRHTGKLAAEKAWSVRIKAGADPEVLIAAASRFSAWVAAGGVDSPRFVPHPATWLNQGREADELPDPRSMSPPAVNGSRRKYDVTDAWADLEKTIGGNDDGSARVASDLRADVRSLPGS